MQRLHSMTVVMFIYYNFMETGNNFFPFLFFSSSAEFSYMMSYFFHSCCCFPYILYLFCLQAINSYFLSLTFCSHRDSNSWCSPPRKGIIHQAGYSSPIQLELSWCKCCILHRYIIPQNYGDKVSKMIYQ